ncbi:error-prone DNA polymerase [Sphingomonas bacterium]|uniref:error-prone DNA polymerase n=1 Tax=Sphingomonas bacterium TaxID=1895847 RepID=UPI0015772B80|nr:error-prone DNA polymerase [Sphingomonas bacterium]
MIAYAELVAATNFSFLHGASHGSDLIGRALDLGHAGLGIADRNTVAGVVRAWAALRDAREKCRSETGAEMRAFKLASGARLVFADGTPDIIAYPEDRRGWGRLCRLLSTGNLRADKGDCVLGIDDLLGHAEGLLLIVLPESSRRAGEGVARKAAKQTVLPADEEEPHNVLRFPARHPGESRDPASPSFERATIIALDPGAQRDDGKGLEAILPRLRIAAPGRVWLGACARLDGKDRRRLSGLARLSMQARVPLIAVNDALYAAPGDRALQDVLTCIRLGLTIDSAGRALEANAERHLKAPEDMARLFADHPQAIVETARLLGRIGFDLDQLGYEYPHEPVPEGWRPQRWLQHLVVTAAREKWLDGVPIKALRMLAEEFRLIRKCGYAYYFLTVHDVVKFARAQQPPILCQGRGSAANSMVCYLLGITSIDPAANDLLFSRFLSEERKEPPDIDVDFEHERREEVMQYIYRRYGRHRAGIVATVIHYRSRSAVREVGKALGLTEDVTTRLVSTVWGSFSSRMEEARFKETGFSLDNPEIERLAHFVSRLLDENYPRHLSQHVGGFVLTEDRLDETVPIHHAAMPDRTFIEWDKDDIDALKLMKVDVLSLGMLTCIRKAFDLIRETGGPDYTLAGIPPDQPDVYQMLCEGDSLGVFQVESRAQMNMLPRLAPRLLYDLVIQVAIVRPGPIQGNMVHPYLRRRQKIEQVDYPSPAPPHPADELEALLGKTLGVPLFQEQAMKLAIVAAEFSSTEANQLRRAMATFRNVGTMPRFEEKMIGGMTKRGYSEEFARRCFDQIKGFGSYGFPESHAQSFAILVYASSYIKRRYPAAFCAALLNAQPMGFYAPAQIVRDAREHGVEVRAIDVSYSGWDNSLEAGEKGPAVRLGLRQIDGFREEWMEKFLTGPWRRTAGAAGGRRGERQGAAPAASPLHRPAADPPPHAGEELEKLARILPARALRLLADADAFRSLGLDRRQALWAVRRLPGAALPLFAAADARELGEEADPALPAMPLSEHVAADYQTTRLSLKQHPMRFLRGLFGGEGVRSAAELRALPDGRRAKAAGVVLVRQRPGNGKAIFVTLEDETGVINVLLWARDFERHRAAVMASRLLEVHGIVQRSPEDVVHLMGAHVVDRTAELGRLSEDHPTSTRLLRADAFEHPVYTPQGTGGRRHPRDVRILPASRDFH